MPCPCCPMCPWMTWCCWMPFEPDPPAKFNCCPPKCCCCCCPFDDWMMYVCGGGVTDLGVDGWLARWRSRICWACCVLFTTSRSSVDRASISSFLAAVPLPIAMVPDEPTAICPAAIMSSRSLRRRFGVYRFWLYDWKMRKFEIDNYFWAFFVEFSLFGLFLKKNFFEKHGHAKKKGAVIMWIHAGLKFRIRILEFWISEYLFYRLDVDSESLELSKQNFERFRRFNRIVFTSSEFRIIRILKTL